MNDWQQHASNAFRAFDSGNNDAIMEAPDCDLLEALDTIRHLTADRVADTLKITRAAADDRLADAMRAGLARDTTLPGTRRVTHSGTGA
jgi:hypothetical protein